jgi:hypothetical protein
MKRVLQLSFIVLFLALVSCEKEEKNLQNEIGNKVTNSMYTSEGLFKNEIVITDESGKNSLFIAIYSDFESAIDEYLNSTKLKLVLEKKEIIEAMKQKSKNIDASVKVDNQKPEIKDEHSVIVEIVRANLETHVEGYSLEVQTKDNNSKSFIYGTYANYVNSSDFAGIVHRGDGYDLWVSTNYKLSWYRPWTNVYAGYLYPSGLYYAYVDTYNTYRTGIGVYLDARQGSINYLMTFSKDNYYGHDCTIGSYDTRNCYVGTPPSGTTAFIYANNFYYTPVSGNQCPMPGSWFDGVNCFVMEIPGNCSPFIWANSWYVKPDIIISY